MRWYIRILSTDKGNDERYENTVLAGSEEEARAWAERQWVALLDSRGNPKIPNPMFTVRPYAEAAKEQVASSE